MKVQDDVRVTFRVDRALKEKSEILFNHLGLNMSTALNSFLRKAVDESAIPFTISMKNDKIGNGYTSAEITNAFEAAVQQSIEENERAEVPIARYDAERKQAYLEHSDGTREYTNA